MKKNKMMRLASVLLVLTLLSTSVISGTFAKYTTQDSASDTARVAKWGVELQVVGNLYGDTYKDLIVKKTATDLTVQSSGESADVVAPGTKNEEGFTISLKGQPEVDGKVTTTMKIQNIFLKTGEYGVMIPLDEGVVTEANFDEFQNLYRASTTEGNTQFAAADSYSAGYSYYTLEDYVNVSADYYPVVYSLTGATSYSNNNYGVDSLNEVAKLLATQLGLNATTADDTVITYTGEKNFDANTNLDTWKLTGLEMNWVWAYDRSNAIDDVGDKAYYTDGADTILGILKNVTEGQVVKKATNGNYILAVEHTDYNLETSFDLDITVTQVD